MSDAFISRARSAVVGCAELRPGTIGAEAPSDARRSVCDAAATFERRRSAIGSERCSARGGGARALAGRDDEHLRGEHVVKRSPKAATCGGASSASRSLLTSSVCHQNPTAAHPTRDVHLLPAHIIKSSASFHHPRRRASTPPAPAGCRRSIGCWCPPTPRGPPPAARPRTGCTRAAGAAAGDAAQLRRTRTRSWRWRSSRASASRRRRAGARRARRRRRRCRASARSRKRTVQQAIEASLMEQEKKRRQSAVDVAAAEAAFAELSAASAVAAPLPSRPRRDEAAERRMLAAVRAVAPGPVVIAKAAVVLAGARRRRAGASPRARPSCRRGRRGRRRRRASSA